MADPVTLGVIAGTSLFSKLLSQRAQEEEARRNRLFQAQQQGFNLQRQGLQAQQQSEQAAIDRLLGSFRNTLL